MADGTAKVTSRRRLLAAGAAASAGLLLQGCKRARKQLRICQWNHFVPGYDRWFNEVYAKRWGEQNDTDVIVDNVGTAALNPAAAAEASAQHGHDLFAFVSPRPVYEEHVIDHAEIYAECEARYGKPIELAVRTTYNPRTKKYFGFCDSFGPDPINFRKDLFDEAGAEPDSWDAIRAAGARIKAKAGIPVGIGLGNESDAAMAVRTILFAFGGSEQDAEGNVALDSPQTLEALKFVKALYQEAMTPEVLSWDPSSNNRAMLAGRTSLVLNAISITREAENKKLAIGDRIWLAKPPRGPARRIGMANLNNVYSIWKFARNIEGAKKFLVDFVGSFREAFRASELYNFPCFPSRVPDLQALLQDDPKAAPRGKYALLADAQQWTANVGYPGTANAGIDEASATWLLNNMFAQAATGRLPPEEAMREAAARYRAIFAKWRERKLQ